MLENRTEPMQEQTWWKLHCASCLLVFCAVVWCCWCWLRSEWGKKPSKPIHILTALFTTRVHKENKQVLPYQPTSGKLWPTQSAACVSFSILENRTEPIQEQAWWKLHCASCLLAFCAFVWCCWCWWWSEFQKTIQTHSYSNCISTTRIHKENRQVLKYQPTLLKTLTNIIYCMCLFQHVGKQDRTHARTHMVKIALRKLFAGILCGCVVLLVLVAKWVREKTIQTYPYSNCTFHHRNSQRKQTSFTVPTDLGKTLANTICCMCLFQHFGKQDRIHARTNMVKTALRKLFAGILCGCVVLLVLVARWVREKNPSKPIHILTALFTTRVHKENKQVLKYQPTSGKLVSVS